MSTRIIKTLSGANDTKVVVKYDTELMEYTCSIPGQPDATYHTEMKADAMGTAELMLRDLELQAA